MYNGTAHSPSHNSNALLSFLFCLCIIHLLYIYLTISITLYHACTAPVFILTLCLCRQLANPKAGRRYSPPYPRIATLHLSVTGLLYFSAIFVNENENGEKRENNKFVNEN